LCGKLVSPARRWDERITVNWSRIAWRGTKSVTRSYVRGNLFTYSMTREAQRGTSGGDDDMLILLMIVALPFIGLFYLTRALVRVGARLARKIHAKIHAKREARRAVAQFRSWWTEVQAMVDAAVDEALKIDDIDHARHCVDVFDAARGRMYRRLLDAVGPIRAYEVLEPLKMNCDFVYRIGVHTGEINAVTIAAAAVAEKRLHDDVMKGISHVCSYDVCGLAPV
jgi:hypothetical protein